MQFLRVTELYDGKVHYLNPANITRFKEEGGHWSLHFEDSFFKDWISVKEGFQFVTTTGAFAGFGELMQVTPDP